MSSTRPRLRLALLGLSAGLITTSFATVAVSPAIAGNVSADDEPWRATAGEVFQLTKTVTTPGVLPKPDIVLLVDRTGSMGGAIANVKDNMAEVIDTVKTAQPDAQFAVAEYCDFGETAPAFDIVQPLTADAAAVTAAVDSIALCDGADLPEAQLNALWQIGAGGSAIRFRPDSSRIVAWFGDAPGHDPSGGHTEADVIASLDAVNARTVAISVGYDQLDATGQATRITQATGGTLLTGVGPDQVANKILEGLTALPVTVAAHTTCDPGLSIELSPATQTVPSGATVTFEEKVAVAPTAQAGTLTCRIEFTLNGLPGGPEHVQLVTVNLTDRTAPTLTCPYNVNPAGNEPASDNADGFYKMIAADDLDPQVDIFITDLGSGARFGPFPTGTTFKLTRAPGGPAKVRDFAGEVRWLITFNGHAQLTAVDDTGNTATTTCTRP